VGFGEAHQLLSTGSIEMPQATDLVINNGAGTPVAKTFTLQVPAAGINGEARWELMEGANPAVFPRLSAVLRPDPSIKGMSSVFKVTYPASYTDTTTGLVKPLSEAQAIITVKMPDDWPEAEKANFSAYVANAANLAVMKGPGGFLRGRVAFT
jgi:hypothetical protein